MRADPWPEELVWILRLLHPKAQAPPTIPEGMSFREVLARHMLHNSAQRAARELRQAAAQALVEDLLAGTPGVEARILLHLRYRQAAPIDAWARPDAFVQGVPRPDALDQLLALVDAPRRDVANEAWRVLLGVLTPEEARALAPRLEARRGRAHTSARSRLDELLGAA